MATEKTPAWRADVPVPEQLVLLIERVRTAIGAMNSAPPMDGGGTYEQRRGHAAAQHLEFEIAPLVGEETLDAAAIVQAIADAAVAQFIQAVAPVQRLGRQSMPLNSGETRIRPGQRAEIVSRPQQAALNVERILIPDAIATDFLIHDIRIGGQAQFAQEGALPGDMFATTAVETFVSFETIQIAMDFVIEVEYVGTNPEGEVFNAVVFGTAEINVTPDQLVREQLLLAANRQAQRDKASAPVGVGAPVPIGTPAERNALLGAWRDIVGGA
jgi:hypothetical protein